MISTVRVMGCLYRKSQDPLLATNAWRRLFSVMEPRTMATIMGAVGILNL